ncbi:hypothetical protein [Limimaricola hongkongensis]|uniref:Seryl-tRNA synthetase n=1 Tax=Limimaricola hongkongensis DSM 17492 TaxID=1122180 RepID=A0A017HAW8_9RHOB|nr:hypothetical protein [Limimaricola hongkongensis]EYD71627.1 hypothetical protein Lokhon_01694 [Limimaricola hongkongensis DSM 17492]
MKTLIAWATLALSVSFAAAPLVTSPFTGFTADQLPVPQIDPPVQPAGWAFSIWGLIYAWLLVSAAYGAWKRPRAEDWHRARWPLLVALGVGTPWLAIANASAIWATITIFVMAAGAIGAFLAAPRRDIWLFRVPVGIFAGWLSAASFVSLGSTAAGYGLVMGQTGWAILCLIAATLLALVVQSRRPRAASYGLTVAWALMAIVVANGLNMPGLVALASLVAILGALALAWRVARRPT